MHLRKAGAQFAILVAALAMLLALTATVAVAGPGVPTMGVDELQAKLDANNGPLPGYLRTVIKGSEIVTLTVDIETVTTGMESGPADMASLIMFSSNDATITKIGGIAAGMSGSPIYVDDAGTLKLVGAVSYGEAFTTGGVAFATPIDAMINLQSYSAGSGMMRELASPVVVDGQLKNRVMVVQDTDAIASVAADTIVVKPLSSVFIGGLSPRSRMYKAYSKVLESKGIEVMTPLAGGLSSKVSTYSAEFEGGSAVAVLAARGDLWAGGIGTVTYADESNDDVVAFGHPAFYDGKSGLYMCNAWIDGIWPSTYEAYKLGRPAAVRGTLTQDRTAGILGVDGLMPEEVSIDATATRGTDVATSSVQLPRFVADSSTGMYFGLATASSYIAGSRIKAFDAGTNPGSAMTTTTVTVRDADAVTDVTYTMVRRNVYSEGYDISMAVVSDVDEMVTSFQEANANGIAHAELVSVGLETDFSEDRNEAEIVDMTVAGGLKHGNNTVSVSLLQYGEVETKTVNVSLNIPANVPVTGSLSAVAVNAGDGGDFSETLFSDAGEGDYGIDRRSVKDVVDEINSAVDNTVVSVTFLPVDMAGEGNGEEPAPVDEFDAIETTRATDWVVSGSAYKIAPQFDVYKASEGPLSYGQRTTIFGELTGVEEDGVIAVTGLGAPKSYRTTDGMVGFDTPALYQKAAIVLTFLGNDSTLPVQATLSVSVKARVSLSASKRTLTHNTPVTLTAKVLPKTAGGKVSFERWNGYMWAAMKTSNLPSSGTLTYKYTPTKKGTVKVRARLFGSATNAVSSSSSISLNVK